MTQGVKNRQTNAYITVGVKEQKRPGCHVSSESLLLNSVNFVNSVQNPLLKNQPSFNCSVHKKFGGKACRTPTKPK